jgi:hypothetical protein
MNGAAKTEFTPTQLREFARYVKVQKSGRYNMIVHARQAASAAGIPFDAYFFIIENYEALEAASKA